MGTVRQDVIAKKSLIKTKLNVSNEGMLTVGYGGVYISQTVVTGVSLETSTSNAITAITSCETCEVTDDAFVTAVSTVLTTEEHLIPLVCQDEFGNVHPVIKGTDKDDTLRIIDATPSQGDAGEGTPDA